MDILLISVSLVLVQAQLIQSTVYYSPVGQHHTDAYITCQSYGGYMLEYGQLFIDTLITCNMVQTYVWVGTPFYVWKTSYGCRNGNANKRTPIADRAADKHVAVCADYCNDTNYTHFGLTTTECFCYDQVTYDALTTVGPCDTPFCTINPYDYCGISPNPVVFEKVSTFNQFECIARSVFTSTSATFFLGYCLIDLPYVCKVGNSNDIKCSLDDLRATTTQVQDQTTAVITIETTSQRYDTSTVELTTDTYTSVQTTDTPTVELTTDTYTSLPTTDTSTVDLTTDTYTSLPTTDTSTVELTTDTYTSLPTTDTSTVELTTDTYTSLPSTDTSTVQLTTDTYSSVQTTDSSTVELTTDTYTSVPTTGTSTVELTTDPYTSVPTTATSTIELTTDTYTSLPTIDTSTVELTTDTYSSVPTTDTSTVELTSDTYTSVPTTDTSIVELTTDTYTSLPTTDTSTVELTTDTYTSVPTTDTSTVELTTDTYITVPTSTDMEITSKQEDKPLVDQTTTSNRRGDITTSRGVPGSTTHHKTTTDAILTTGVDTTSLQDQFTTVPEKDTTAVTINEATTPGGVFKSTTQQANTVKDGLLTTAAIETTSLTDQDMTTSGTTSSGVVGTGQMTTIDNNQGRGNNDTTVNSIPTYSQDLLIGLISGVGGLLFVVLILVVVIRACCKKVSADEQARKQQKLNSIQQEEGSVYSDSQMSREMYNFPKGVKPFDHRRRLYDNEIVSYENLGYFGPFW